MYTIYRVIKTKENRTEGRGKSMKILMLTWEYPPRVVGGISRVVYDLSHRLIKDGHEVTVVTYRDGETPYFEDDKGVKVYRIDNYMINPNNFIDWIMQMNFRCRQIMIIMVNGCFVHRYRIRLTVRILRKAVRYGQAVRFIV